jgi:LCP family protein required for cell wall assembly
VNRSRIYAKAGRFSSPDRGMGAGRPGAQRARAAEGGGNGGGGRRRGWFIRHKVATVILAIVAAGLVVGGYYGVRAVMAFNDPASVLTDPTHKLASEEPGEPTDGAPSAALASPAAGTTEEPPPELQTARDDVNILVLGSDLSADRRDDPEFSGVRTDCVILVHMTHLRSGETPEISLISVPRDTWLTKIYAESGKRISGDSGQNRINTVYAKGGIEGAKKTIGHFLGDITIDRYVFFDMDLVKDLIDAVGGVDVMVQDLTGDTVTTVTGVTFKNNTVMHMDGLTALTYARDRHNTKEGDIRRVKHQQDVMMALLQTLKKQGNIVAHAKELYTAFATYVTTDMNDLMQIAALASIANRIDISAIKSYSIGRSEDIHMRNGQSIITTDPKQKAEVLKAVFGIDYKTPDDETPSAIMRDVYQAVNSGQAAVDNANALMNGNLGYYSESDAAPLKNAVAAWQAQKDKHMVQGMLDAQKTVESETGRLKGIIDANKAAPPTSTPPPSPSHTAETPPPSSPPPT